MIDGAGLTLLIGNLGFPIVAFFLMYRLADKTIKENSIVLSANSKVIGELKSAIDILASKMR